MRMRSAVPAGPRALAHLLCLSACCLADRDPDRPPFFDYDCDLVGTTRTPAADWNAVYASVQVGVARAGCPAAAEFRFPEEYRDLVDGPRADQAEAECPLGVLHLRTLDFYARFEADSGGKGLVERANHVQRLLQSFHVYSVALSRWPIFYALDHFAPLHAPQRESLCDGEMGVLDWGELRAMSLRWTDTKRVDADRVDTDARAEYVFELETNISDRFFSILRRRSNHEQAQSECEFGFYFLAANQVVAAANRDTQHLPNFNQVLNHAIANVHFIKIASSGWPIPAVLAIFSDLNKGAWFFGGDRKYLRGYSDWNLRSDELSPLVPSRLQYLSPEWRAAARDKVSSLVGLPAAEFSSALHAQVLHREEADGPLRPIVRSLVDVAHEIAAAPGSEVPAPSAGARRLVYMVLLYGAGWADLLARLAGRLRQLGIVHPLFVIAIGPDAARSCLSLAADRWRRVLCWVPDSQSQVHRFTAMHALLHLGIDIIYVDMDTFMLRDPTPRILAQAVGYDALFARHADADCINIGVFFLRAGADVAIWFSQYLAWYHDHPFEIDQRGMHVFLRLPTKSMNIAYLPEDLVHIRGGVLEDVNEVVIGDVGWHGDLSRMLIFHWCHRPLEQKESEIRAAYDAADAAETHGIPLAVAVATTARAVIGSPWEKVLEFRSILEQYRKDAPPERTPCW